MKYIEFFNSISKDDSKIYGGKAASLGEMTQVGIPVPNGFAISAQACRDFVGRELSKEFEKELLSAFDELDAERVAVRSSAIAEDASDASWAGQLESYLNVGQDTLVKYLKECWDSIKSERAKSYAADKNVSEDDLLVAVVVQKMVDSEKSGVMFTANPITSDRDTMIVEAVYGLGEMIVQGTMTPDHWDVAKQPLKVTNFEIAVKDEMMVYEDEENKIVKVPENLEDKAILREGGVLEIARLGLKIEEHYGKPQDIEWAFVDGNFYIVQSRPITTLQL